MQMTHKHKKWLQILVDEDFPRKLLWSENADLKFSVNNEGEDLNKKPLSPASKGKADNKKQRNRGTGDWNIRGIMIVLRLWKTHI